MTNTLNQGQATLLMQQMNVAHEQMEIFKAAKQRTLLSRALAHYRKLNSQLTTYTPTLLNSQHNERTHPGCKNLRCHS